MSALGAHLRRHPDRAAAAVLIALPLVLFAPALRPGQTLSPLDNLFTAAPWRAIAPGPVQPNQALGDITAVFHPWTLWAAREVWAGRAPLWNPHAYAGAPFSGDGSFLRAGHSDMIRAPWPSDSPNWSAAR